MSAAADVYQGTRLVATISRTNLGYRVDLLPHAELNKGRLATSLPASAFPVESAELHPFFLNLLPEGARLQLLLDTARSNDDTLDLLLRVGWDAVGDVAIVAAGKFLQPDTSAKVDNPALVSFRELFESSALRDAAIAGVQEKLSDATIAFSVGRAGRFPAILKLNPRAYPRLVQNEAFFLRVGAACGIEVNRAELIEDRTGEFGLLVTRFDRAKKGKTITKLHQEDGCQLLDLVPARKYRPTMRQIAEALQAHASAPVVEGQRLLRLIVFSYLIGNCDLHAKNISLLWREVVTLSPAYDLLSTLPYPGLSWNMALTLEGKDDNFKVADFEAFGGRLGVPAAATRKLITKLTTSLGPWLLRLDEIGYDVATTDALRREIGRRIDRLTESLSI